MTQGLENPLLHMALPRDNMWVAWADGTNTSSFCLSLESVTDPFHTCLVGIPTLKPEKFMQYLSNASLANHTILRQEA